MRVLPSRLFSHVSAAADPGISALRSGATGHFAMPRGDTENPAPPDGIPTSLSHLPCQGGCLLFHASFG